MDDSLRGNGCLFKGRSEGECVDVAGNVSPYGPVSVNSVIIAQLQTKTSALSVTATILALELGLQLQLTRTHLLP